MNNQGTWSSLASTLLDSPALQKSVAKFPIVGIGASAYSQEALQQLFNLLPASSEAAYVVVQDLPANSPSHLLETLQSVTKMQVIEATDQLQVKVNCVYTIPPNCDMRIVDGTLTLSLRDPLSIPLPIDVFFSALAADQKQNAVGIMLCGTEHDGAAGFAAINNAGGTTIAHQETLNFTGMATNTIKAGEADHIYKLEDIAQFLIDRSQLSQWPTSNAVSPDSYTQILAQLLTATGVDFTLYKKSTIERCIHRAMAKHNIPEIDQYPAYLKDKPAELSQLFKELLINVTHFFRDAEAFEIMAQVALPQLLNKKADNSPLRIWVPSCASGEEAYSIAILVREYLDRTQQQLQVKIYSTDIDDDAITTARAGVYPSSISLDVSPERLSNFFVKHEAGYRIKKEIREMVVFAVQNVIKDPPFIKLDLISCRNLLIYLELPLQKRVLSMFHYALNPGGMLLLSPSESIGNNTELFRPVDRKWKLYQAIHNQTSSEAAMNKSLTPPEQYQLTTDITPSIPPKINFADLSRKLLIKYFASTSIITNLKGDIFHIHGESAKYLSPLTDHGSQNIIELAHDGLALELRNAIHDMANGLSFFKAEIPYQYKDEAILINLSVRKLPALGPDLVPGLANHEDFLLLSFEHTSALTQPHAAIPVQPDATASVSALELELTSAKENLYAVIEEQNATNEEFIASNEALQASNEELQSFNEELITVNSELMAKIQLLSHSHADMASLHENINIATIFLDTHMRIRRFTPDASKIYRLVAPDAGRLLNDIKSNLVDDSTLCDAENVLETLVPIEREVTTIENEWYLMRIQPYRTMDNLVDGVTITFIDITSRIHTENVAIEAYDLVDNIVNTIREPILVLNRELKITSSNKAFCQFFHATFMDTVGHVIYDLDRRYWDIPALRVLLEVILPQEQVVNDYFIEHDFPHIGHRQLSINGRYITDKAGEPSLILLTMIEKHSSFR